MSDPTTTPEPKIRIRNWKHFQHFKDRCPPWIKLHRCMLEQRDIMMISDCSFRVLVGCWLLASEDKAMCGTLPPVDDIAFRLRMDKQVIINALQNLLTFLECDDINAISARYQTDVPETETEGETKTEKETHPAVPPQAAAQSKKEKRQKWVDPISWTPLEKWNGITNEDYDSWEKAYPAIVIDVELEKATQWLLAHPAESHKSLWRKFITGWFGRAQERGRS